MPATVTAYPPHTGSLLSLFPRSDGSGALFAWLPGGGAPLLAKLKTAIVPSADVGGAAVLRRDDGGDPSPARRQVERVFDLRVGYHRRRSAPNGLSPAA